MKDERGPWYLLTGLVLGAILGLAYAWMISPVEYVNTTPAALRSDFKERYRALIAAAYVANGSLERAQARLGLLGDKDIARSVAEQAQQTLADGRSPEEARALGLLAVALGQGPTPVLTDNNTAPTVTPSAPPADTLLRETHLPETAVVVAALETGTPGTQVSEPLATATLPPEPTRTQLPTGTPLPTRTATPTPAALIALQDQTFICDQNLPQPLIQVVVEDASGEQMPGVEVIVNWEGGEDRFYTGLKAELGLGYADFRMSPGVVYTLYLAGGGQQMADLTPAECELPGGGRYWGSWLLVFQQE